MIQRKTPATASASEAVAPPPPSPPSQPPPRVKASPVVGTELWRKILRALAAVLAVAALIYLAAVLSARTGLWSWEEMFPPKGRPLFDAVKECWAVHAGPETPCSNVWESTCFDRERCFRVGPRGGGRGGGVLSVYVHDEACSMRSTSEIVAEFRDEDVPKVWSSEPAAAFRQAADSRYPHPLVLVCNLSRGNESSCARSAAEASELAPTA